MNVPPCQFCKAPLRVTFADLGVTPLANSYIDPARANEAEPFYPLHARVCEDCRLVQLESFETPEQIFRDYLYFSSYSESWLRHCQAYASMMTERFSLSSDSLVAEVASNDGYLLQYFQKAGVPVLGIEPAENVAKVAIDKGIPTETVFFGVESATAIKAKGHQPDLIAAKNVMAHVPDIRDFVGGFKALLKPGGVITVEFPHLVEQIKHNQFDTVYHEHFSYLSLLAAERVFNENELRIFDVEHVPTHGGSLRIFGCHADDPRADEPGLAAAREQEAEFGLASDAVYEKFAARVIETKLAVLDQLVESKPSGIKVAAYGAPAKGNTLLNYCGIGRELIPFTVDRSPHKQGTLLPGTRIPVHAPEHIDAEKPDVVWILPWNLREEIASQLAHIREWGGRFMVAIPEVEIW